MNLPAMLAPRRSASQATVLATPEPSRSGAAASSRFRPDIETLRAVAVLSVLVYHLNARWLPGGFVGVDVFFVISGFLITAHLTGELTATGTLSLRRFYGRRILRLIPASTVVLLTTLVAVALTQPRFVWRQFGLDSAAASGYLLNWALAARSVDYLAEDALPSPWQHYWSLGVEEQFYLIWPVLLIALALLARGRHWPVRRVLTLGAAGIATLSFAWAAQRTAAGEPSAYFTTTTRLWELGIGAIGALVISRVQRSVPTRLRSLLVGFGLVCLALSITLLSGTGWPGWPALLPTTATLLVIVCGGPALWPPMRRALATPPMVWVGGVSYAVYLWHWPLITLAQSARGPLTLTLGASVVAATLLLAWASRRWVENPVRFSPWLRRLWWRPFALGAGCLAVSLSASLSLVFAAPTSALRPPPGAKAAGARVLPARITLTGHPDWSRNVAWVVPSPLDAQRDVPVAYADGCQQSLTDSAPLTCAYGDVGSSRVVAVVGDSKALQWLPALDAWARQHQVRIVTYLKSSCPLSDAAVRVGGASYPSCRSWNAAVLQRLAALHPALVMTSQVRLVADGAGQVDSVPAMVTGLRRSWSALLSEGIAVAVLADTPQPELNIDACVAERPDDLGACAYDRAKAQSHSAYPAQLAAVRALHGTTVDASGAVSGRPGAVRLWFLDLTDAVCPDATRCPPVVGNVLVYRSGSHLTQTYVVSLSARLARLLDSNALLR